MAARTVSQRSSSWSRISWNKQREFQDVQEYIDSNKAILATVRAEQKDQIKVERFGDGAPFVIVPNMDFDYVKERIFDKFCFVYSKT